MAILCCKKMYGWINGTNKKTGTPCGTGTSDKGKAFPHWRRISKAFGG